MRRCHGHEAAVSRRFAAPLHRTSPAPCDSSIKAENVLGRPFESILDKGLGDGSIDGSTFDGLTRSASKSDLPVLKSSLENHHGASAEEEEGRPDASVRLALMGAVQGNRCGCFDLEMFSHTHRRHVHLQVGAEPQHSRYTAEVQPLHRRSTAVTPTVTPAVTWPQVSAEPKHNRDGKVVGAVCVGEDVLARRRVLREQLRNHQLQETNAAKDAFLASMSHEMRTPLNGLLGMLQLALAASDYSSAFRFVKQVARKRTADDTARRSRHTFTAHVHGRCYQKT